MIGGTSRYVDLATFRDYLSSQGSLSTSQDGLLQDCLNRAETAIDSYTRHNFLGTPGTALYSRYYQERVIDNAFWLDRDLHTLVSLTTGNGISVPVGSVWLEPQGQTPPYRAIRLHSQYVYTWNTDQDMIISGTWGYGTVVPDDVMQSVLRQAAYLYRGKDVGYGQTDVAGFPEAGEVPITQGLLQDVRWLLSPYRSKTGGAV